jgi:heme-degrading monooxygenase HmoA
MPYGISHRRVADYAQWKRGWDELFATRQEKGGVQSEQLFRNPDDPSEVVVLRAVVDLERAGHFFQSDEAQEARRRGGARDRIRYVPEPEQEPVQSADNPSACIIARATIPDYAQWKQNLNAGAAARQDAGAKRQYIFRNPDDPRQIAVLTEFGTAEQARAYQQSAHLREALQRHGPSDRVVYYPEA